MYKAQNGRSYSLGDFVDRVHASTHYHSCLDDSHCSLGDSGKVVEDS